jgi:hypothetical protein
MNHLMDGPRRALEDVLGQLRQALSEADYRIWYSETIQPIESRLILALFEAESKLREVQSNEIPGAE